MTTKTKIIIGVSVIAAAGIGIAIYIVMKKKSEEASEQIIEGVSDPVTGGTGSAPIGGGPVNTAESPVMWRNPEKNIGRKPNY
ncbi:MAG: hypothetical protein UV51_C0010G0037 [Candidatus Woesebacteria bacterium GW2011_GWC1_42_9]|nr:MAG: hypothetical protein UV51_C0010G0037 [Candidatus Woesebacteria bacterium GW2011_GWC1_42_9]